MSPPPPPPVPSFGRIIFVPTTVFDETVRAIHAVTVFALCTRNLWARTVHVLTPIYSCAMVLILVSMLSSAFPLFNGILDRTTANRSYIHT